ELYLDPDRNPYNGNTASRFARRAFPKSSSVTSIRLSGTTAEAAPGTYYVFAKSVDSTGVARYSYLPRKIKLVAPSENFLFANLNKNSLSIAGTSGDDRVYVTGDGTTLSATRGDFTQMFSAAS